MMALDELYQEILLDHYQRPRNRRPGSADAVAVRHENPLCGDEVTLTLACPTGVVSDIAWTGTGCLICLASASMLTEAVTGLPVALASGLAETVRRLMHGEAPDRDLGDLMCLAGVARFPVRIKCALLPWAALAEAIDRSQASVPPDLAAEARR